MIVHGTLPEPGRWAEPRGTSRAALAGRFRGVPVAVKPVGRGLPFERLADGAGLCRTGFDRRTDGSGLARSASVRGPTIPETGNPCARWNRLTAPSVSTP